MSDPTRLITIFIEAGDTARTELVGDLFSTLLHRQFPRYQGNPTERKRESLSAVFSIFLLALCTRGTRFNFLSRCARFFSDIFPRFFRPWFLRSSFRGFLYRISIWSSNVQFELNANNMANKYTVTRSRVSISMSSWELKKFTVRTNSSNYSAKGTCENSVSVENFSKTSFIPKWLGWTIE